MRSSSSSSRNARPSSISSRLGSSTGPTASAQPSNAVAFHGGVFAGSREGREVWTSEKLPKETARQIERTLTSGRLLVPEEPGEEGEGEMEQIGLLTE